MKYLSVASIFALLIAGCGAIVHRPVDSLVIYSDGRRPPEFSRSDGIRVDEINGMVFFDDNAIELSDCSDQFTRCLESNIFTLQVPRRSAIDGVILERSGSRLIQATELLAFDGKPVLVKRFTLMKDGMAQLNYAYSEDSGIVELCLRTARFPDCLELESERGLLAVH